MRGVDVKGFHETHTKKSYLFSRERISKLSNNLYKYEQGIGLRKAQLLSYEDRAAIYNYYKPSNEKLLFHSKNPKNQFIKNWEKDLEKDKHSSGIISKRSFTKDIIRVLEKVLNEKIDGQNQLNYFE